MHSINSKYLLRYLDTVYTDYYFIHSGWCVDPPSPPPTSCKLCKLGYTSKVSWEQHPVQSSVLMLGYPHLTAFNRYNPAAVLQGFLEGNVISVRVHNTDNIHV